MSTKCECQTEFGGLICTVPKLPDCFCTSTNNSHLCPVNFVNGECPVRGPNNRQPYSAPGRKSGERCSGFILFADNSTKPGESGLTDCSFCYGRDKITGVPGAACRGQVNSGETNIDGHLVCDR